MHVDSRGTSQPDHQPERPQAAEATRQRGGARAVAYWLQQLAGLPRIHALPLDRLRPARLGSERAAVRSQLAADLTARFLRLCEAQGASAQMGLLTAFGVLLARHSGSDDIVIGLPQSTAAAADAPILALRSAVGPRSSFCELLAADGKRLLDASLQGGMTPEQLTDLFDPGHDASYVPVVQVFLLRPGQAVPQGLAYELLLRAEFGADGLALDWLYATELFDAATIERLAEHFGHLLHSVIAQPDEPIWRLPLLGEAERDTLLRGWNATEAPWPSQRCLHEWVAQQAAATPDAIALDWNEVRLDYATLNRRANQLAHHLRGLGVATERVVGVCLERSADLIVALLAVLKAGGTYVPLDPDYPADRVAFMLSDSGARWAVTQSRLQALVSVEGVQPVVLDAPETPALLQQSANTDPPRLADGGPHNLAYLIYTSGSTGVPKGVCIEHRNAVAMVSWAHSLFTAEELSGVLAATSVCFDLSIFEIFVPLCRGGRIIVVNNALDFGGIARARDLTLINTVPSAIKVLVEEGQVPASVQVVNLAGEALPGALVQAIYRTTPVRAVYNLYGPSEDTTYSTGALIGRDEPREPVIGRPLSNGQVYVLDAQRQPVPIGVVGEIYVGGAGVARGYWNRPELTEERFTPDPFRTEPGARLYRTGDLGRWRADGELEYAGRIDHQIKLRGFRIELGEIEARLRQHEAVKDVVLVAMPDAQGEKQLVAYVVPPEGMAASAALVAQYKSYLREHLPEYMVPAQFLLLDALPLTPNGKVDRKALPRPLAEAADSVQFVAPEGEWEQRIASLWQDVLQRSEPVSATANFFALGGHSLQATRLLARLRQQDGIDMPLKALFVQPVLRDFARRVAEQGQNTARVAVAAQVRSGWQPLSSAQRRLWFIDQLEGGSAHYNLQSSFRIDGELDLPRLQQALDALVQRHASLRTVYAESDGQPVQEVRSAATVSLAVYDLAELGGEETSVADRLQDDDLALTFDLSRDTLLRASVLRLDAQRHLFWFTVHHIATDGWSLAVMHEDLGALYRQQTLPELPLSYADFAVWERDWLGSGEHRASLDYWRRQLAGVPAVHNLPADRPRPPQQSTQGHSVRSTLDAAATAALRRYCREQGATLFMGLHALFSLLLGRHSNETDIVVGTAIANRDQAELAGIVGCFVNTLVLRSDLSARPGFRQMLAQSRHTALEAYDHQHLPFDELIEHLQPTRSLAYNPVFQIMLVLQNTTASSLELPGAVVRQTVASAARTSLFDLLLEVTEDENGLSLEWIYATALFDAERMTRLAADFTALIHAALADPEANRWSLPSLPDPQAPARTPQRVLQVAAPAAQAYVAPATRIEQDLARLWQELLQREQPVSALDHFFELGGHSLLAMRMLARLRQQHGLSVPLKALFTHPVLRAFGEIVGASAGDDSASLQPVPRDRPLPLSSSQLRLWFVDRMLGGSLQYNLQLAFRIDGALDLQALQLAYAALVQRHESLRTVFVYEDGQPRQKVLARTALLARRDLRAVPAAQQAQQLDLLLRQEVQRPYALDRDLMLRLSVLQLAPQQHVLVLGAHHIAVDGSSLSVIMQELGALYSAAVRNEAAALAQLPLQYADYAVWEREHQRSTAMEKQRQYWSRQLAGLPTVHQLPLDRQRPPQPGVAGSNVSHVLPAQQVAAFQRLCQEQGATLFMGLHALYSLLLARHSGERDIVIGTPVANRSREEISGLVGCFINTLVLRSDLSAPRSFRELLDHSRSVALDAFSHQEVPFEHLVELLQPERSLAVSPLFQILLVLQDGESTALKLDGCEVGALPQSTITAQYELTLQATPTPDGLALDWLYATELFDAATIERLAEHFGHLLHSVIAQPDEPIWRLPLLGEAERDTLLRGWNATEAPWPSQRCLHEWVAQQAAATPDAIALDWNEVRLDYATLNRRANQLAHHLRGLGVATERVVGVCLERSADLIVALLAVLKAGGTYVPLDPDYPADRVAFMLSDSGARWAVTQSRLQALVSVEGVQPVVLDAPETPALLQQSANTDPPRLADGGPHNLAYLIYTSGSTGVPKGVCIEHRNAVAMVSWAHSLFTAEELSGVLAATSVCFDLSIFEIFVPLCRGGRIIVVNNALDFGGIARARDLTLINTVPSAIKVLVEEGQVPASVQVVNLAGEALPGALVQAIYRTTPVRAVYNLYGPSEDTTYSTGALIGRDEPREPVIGRPLSNGQVYVLDAQRQPVPIGVVGEIYVGGAGVARGYWNRPELTEERFTPDPFRTEPGARLYRTGDLGRWRADGELEYAGRIDHQIKLRGFRIELGEIEARLRQHEAVKDVVLVAMPDAQGEKQLVAYVVPPEGMAASAALVAQYKSYLREHLPEYMVPAQFLLLDALPLTPNGKVDRKALPRPLAEAADSVQFVAPEGEWEQRIASLWQDVLQRSEPVSATANFFALGGHSLQATRLLARLRQQDGIDMPLKALFVQPVLRDFARRVAEQGQNTARVAVAAQVRSGWQPLSSAQRRLWFIDQLEGGSAHYNLQSSFRIDGELDLPRLQQALDALVQRHASLRTVYAVRDGSPRQQVRDAAAVTLQQHDLSTLADDARQAQATRHLQDDALQVFDLSRDTLLRAGLLRLGPQQQLLWLTLHHIAADGWALDIVFQELSALYVGAPLAANNLTYADYAAWENDRRNSEDHAQDLRYWTRRLAGLPSVHNLPLDRPRPPQQGTAGASLHTTLDPAATAALRRLCQQHNATVFMGLHALFALLLARHSGDSDIVIGTPVANREQGELAGIVGCFVNTLVLRSDLSAGLSFHQLLAQTRSNLLEAYAHQRLPFDDLIEHLQPARSLAYNSLFQIALSLQRGAAAAALALDGTVAEALAPQTYTTKFELTLDAVEWEDRIELAWVYSTTLFDADSIARLAGHFEVLLRGATAEPERNVHALGLLTADEWRVHESVWNGTAAAYDSDTPIHQQFARQRALAPDAPAVAQGPICLSYDQLDRAANGLAHELIAAGAARGSVIGVLAARSPELIAAALAIFKIGAIYLPLDPAYPDARLAFMLADSAAAVVLVQPALRGRAALAGAASLPLPPAGESAAGGELPWQGSAHDTAYVIYTSGSTGQPKGVAVSHAALSNLCQWHKQTFRMDGDSVASHMASIGFDASLWEVWPCLLAGGCVVAVSDEERATPGLLDTLLERHRVTHSFLPTGLLELMAGLGAFASPHLRYVFTGGDKLQRYCLPANCRAELVNCYGPTEAAVVSSSYVVRPDSPAPPPIGLPISNGSLYVLNRARQVQPAGVAGELYIGGDNLALGYVGAPQLTVERFQPVALDGVPRRLYRSGDLVRRRADGNIDFLGRIDDQVKVRGFRIELGEIEAALAALPAVSAAFVMLREDEPGLRQLVAYVVPADAAAADAAALRAALAHSLPEYMLPTVLFLDALPLTANGKVDRQALPAPAGSSADAAYEAPAGAVEEQLAAIWRELFGREQISAAANFFALGGHSLLVIRLIHAVSAQLGATLSVRDVFQHPSLRELAGLIGQGAAGEGGLVHVPQQSSAPLTLSQFRVWYVEQVRGATDEHNMPTALRWQGRIDAALLQRALDHLVRRHDALRTGLRLDGAQPQLQVAEAAVFPLQVRDLRRLAPEQRAAEAQQLARQHAAAPFDLAQAPLAAALLLQLDEQDFRLQLNFHHAIFDGWSFGLFHDELIASYEAFAAGTEPALAKPEFTYLDFSHWQQRWLAGAEAQRQAAFWRGYLQDCSEQIALPGLRGLRRDAGEAGTRLTARIDGAVRERLLALARQHRGSLFNVLYSGFALLLARLSGQDDLTIGIPVNGRHVGGTERLLGNFLNNLPVRNRGGLEHSFAGYLDAQTQNLADVLSHQDYPFEKILELVPRARAKDSTPLFQVFFNMFSLPPPQVQAQSFRQQIEEAPEIEAKFDLTLYVVDSADGVELTCHYARGAFARDSMAQMLRQYVFLLEQIAVDAEQPCLAYSLRAGGPAERTDELQAARFWPGPVHEVFLARAAQTPAAVAIEEQGQQWSYAELAASVRALAAQLQRAGVGKGDVVGIVAARRGCMVAGVLATLATGAAFSLLNPEYPVERVCVLADIVAPRQILFAGDAGSFSPQLEQRLAASYPCLWLPARKPADTRASADFTPVPIAPDQPACLTFTSGTTGIPKAVAGIHIGLAGYLHWVPQWLEITPRDRFSMFSGLGHDPIQRDMFGPLCTGATLVIPDADVFAPQLLAQWLKQNAISFVHMTPAMSQILCATDETAFEHLRVTFLTGEKLHSDAVAALLRFNPAMRILNSYGTTETQRAVTYFEASELRGYDGVIPAGESAPDAVLRVLNAAGTPCGLGEIGELFLESHHLSMGYRNDAALTANVLSDLGGGLRRYRTGDIGCRLPGGMVLCLGRKDGQTNIRGFRVETGEIETHARRVPQVKDAVVVALPKVAGGELFLVAYVVRDDERTNARNLRAAVAEHLAAQLPNYMVPSAIVVIDGLPLTPNGKLDRRALPEPAWGEAASYEPPATPMEAELAAIWAEVLRLERVGVTDNFFEIGGHSVLQVLLLSQMRKRLNLRFNLTEVIGCATIRAQAAVLARHA
ncbi:non-ribosomal peptide synthetase [Tahibacter harae]|uniref:Amino acid adenylation domain-containing protein n=1 Tax=Tahibacter harae TaxID=2963937 RepID=A0ABT1QLS4_9GAMM|nr:non-ribosomal peptide synthetase [Tahibacter harae]MCQ4163486.1 amino acid adenylation domain-containing protein [Tahibacter harae]